MLVGQAGGFGFGGGLFFGQASLLVLLGFSFRELFVIPDRVASVEYFPGDQKVGGNLREMLLQRCFFRVAPVIYRKLAALRPIDDFQLQPGLRRSCFAFRRAYLSCRRKDEKRFFFKHRTENGNCPAITRGALSKDEMLARKYNAAKETRNMTP